MLCGSNQRLAGHSADMFAQMTSQYRQQHNIHLHQCNGEHIAKKKNPPNPHRFDGNLDLYNLLQFLLHRR